MTALHTRQARILLGLIATVTLALALVPRLQAHAGTNLVNNGTFDTDLNGWTVDWPQTASLSWSSGHIAVTAVENTDLESAGWADQCINGITAGQKYQLEDDVLLPANQVRAGHGEGAVIYFAKPDCKGAYLAGETAPQCPCKDGLWHHQTEAMVSPAGASSVLIHLNAVKITTTNGFPGQPSDNITAWFDNIIYSAVGAPPIPTPTATATATSTPPSTAPSPSPTTPPPPPPTSTPTTPRTTSTPPTKTPPPPTSTPPWEPPTLPQGGTTPPPIPPTSATPPSSTATPGNPGTPAAATTPPLAQHNAETPPPTEPSRSATPLPPQTGSGAVRGGGHGGALILTAIAIICTGGLGLSLGGRPRR